MNQNGFVSYINYHSQHEKASTEIDKRVDTLTGGKGLASGSTHESKKTYVYR